jgi:hypothetical protein
VTILFKSKPEPIPNELRVGFELEVDEPLAVLEELVVLLLVELPLGLTLIANSLFIL